MSKKLGVICNIEKNKYYIITDGGDFVMQKGTPPEGKGMGDRVDLPSSRGIGLTWLSIAAALILMVVSSMHFLPMYSEDDDFHLSLDINPSMELSYNAQFELTGWRAFNQAGTDLLESLEQPGNVYEALAMIFSRSLQLGLAEDHHDVFITTLIGTPLDEDRVLGAFEGRGAAVKLHLVRLDEDDYQGDKDSPLKAHLKRKAGIALDDDSPVAALAVTHLNPELVTSIQVAPWHNNPLVQLFVEQYMVSGNMVEQMLAEGMTAQQTAHLLELARAEKLTPADIFKELRTSGLTPGQFLQQHKNADKVKAPAPIVMDWLPEFLAQEFKLSGGQISSYLRRGINASDLQALLVLERMTGEKLQQMVRRLETSDIQRVITESGVDPELYTHEIEQLDNLVNMAETWVDSKVVKDLTGEFKVSKAEVLSIIARGYVIDEVREVIGIGATGRFSIDEVLDLLDKDEVGEDIMNELDGEHKAPNLRDKIKNNPPGRGSAPGQQEAPPGKQPGKPGNSTGQGKGNN